MEKGRHVPPGSERPDDRAAEQRRILEQRVKQARDRASRMRKAAKRSLDVTPQTGNPGGEVRTRTQPSGETAENAGKPGRDVAPSGAGPLHWQDEPDAQAFPTVQPPLSQPLARDLVGRNIRHAKELTGVGQLELARRTGITRQQLREYELGRVMPTVKNLAQIAPALGFPIEWFLTEHAGEVEA
jgi:DNA-binding XRE family transcriptional regulator